MNLNNFTIKATEAIQQAQQLAFNQKHPNIETEHILKALLQMEDSPISYLLKKNNVVVNLLENKLNEKYYEIRIKEKRTKGTIKAYEDL